MSNIKHKIIKVGLVIVVVMATVVMQSTTVSALPPIPFGCPDSPLIGPGSPIDCASIRIGCPGSTQQGQVATPPTNCPYAPGLSAGGSGPAAGGSGPVSFGDSTGKYYCGDGDQVVNVAIDIGCKGKGGHILNPITDAAFAIIRFLSLGVGLIIVGSMTFAGIQYSASRGDPKATAAAIGRIRSNVVAFLIFIFSFAILNFVIPQGFFSS